MLLHTLLQLALDELQLSFRTFHFAQKLSSSLSRFIVQRKFSNRAPLSQLSCSTRQASSSTGTGPCFFSCAGFSGLFRFLLKTIDSSLQLRQNAFFDASRKLFASSQCSQSASHLTVQITKQFGHFFRLVAFLGFFSFFTKRPKCNALAQRTSASLFLFQSRSSNFLKKKNIYKKKKKKEEEEEGKKINLQQLQIHHYSCLLADFHQKSQIQKIQNLKLRHRRVVTNFQEHLFSLLQSCL